MTDPLSRASLSRRELLSSAGVLLSGSVAAGALTIAAPALAAEGPAVKLPRVFAPTDRESGEVPQPLPPDQRVGFAIVGLGRLAIEEILPAFAECRFCRPVALVSGHAAKASELARRHGIPERSVYDYAGFDRLANDPSVSVVYIVLPNGMHAEYTVRALRAGKHVLCEKPMANSVDECDTMIDAAKKAGKKLMIAYRMQYEPYTRELIRLARGKELGRLKGIMAANAQNQGDPKQWRLKKALAGGGALPDVGIYCLNAARYVTGEEPTSVFASVYSTPKDPRFAEVEEQVDFSLRFPSGLVATCSTSYGAHTSKFLRVHGEAGWAEMDPAFSYHGQRLLIAKKSSSASGEERREMTLQPKNQFAEEMDHMARCVLDDKPPHTPGEEGRQDHRIMAALYQSGEQGRVVELSAVSGKDAFRGPAPA